MELDNRPSWLSRAMNKNTPTKGRATVQTRSEYVTDLGGEVIYPTLRMGKDGKLRDADIDEAINKKDYILVKGPLGKETADKATAKSKQISKQIGIARQMKQGGVMAKAKKARAGLGVLPMTKKTTNPSGNKNQPVQKVPQTGAAPKVVDPRDEAIKLVSKKMKQDKKETTGTPVPVSNPTPETPVPLVPPMQPVQPNIPDDETPPIPVKMKKGGMKDKKGLAVVIGMEPSYEEASKGTPQDPPPGATADEVKDDQHVLLSEGELVVPANVVRYHGLGLYEGLRRDALQGLGEMEQSGQVEYVNDEPKKAAAGLALASGPSVATTSGIAQQQQQYNPSLGLYGTATTPQAASAKYVTTNFVDRNRDGISDNLQPSVNRGLVAPANYIAPANLALGPVTNPNMVVGAPNVKSYVQHQNENVDSGTSAAVTADTTQRSAPIVQQPRYEQSSDDGQSEEALLGGARTTINGIDYAVQYDFQGNITGLANVAESMKMGRPNFFEPSNELKELISIQTAGQNAELRGMVSPVSKGLAYIDDRLSPFPDDEKKRQAGKIANDKLNRYTGTMSRQEEMAKPDIIYGDAAIDDLDMFKDRVLPAVKTPTVKAPEVKSSIDDSIDDYKGIDDLNMGPLPTAVGSASELRTANIGTPPGSKERIYEDRMFQSGINRQSPSPYGSVPMPSALGFSEDRVSDAYSDGYEGAPTYRGPGKQLGEETGTSEFQARKEQREQQEEREALLNQPNRQTPSSFVTQNFSEAGKQDVSVHNRGEDGEDKGPLGIGVNDNGTSYSRNRDGTFTHEDGTTVNFTGSDGKPGNAPTKDEAREKRMAERTAKYDDPTDDTATSGEKNIVCTEMYRQTQLDDWAQAMKMWSVYQRKYLTTTHQIGYHWLFKPFVRGMKVNRVLTTIGASLAKKRTQHLRHVLTKGKAKDSILGNLFCKIIHPIVYLVGLAVRKK